MTPALAAEYAPDPGPPPFLAAIELMLTIDPVPRSTIAFPTICDIRNMLLRFRLITESQLATDCVMSAALSMSDPALLTRMSIGPNRETVSSIRNLIASGFWTAL